MTGCSSWHWRLGQGREICTPLSERHVLSRLVAARAGTDSGPLKIVLPVSRDCTGTSEYASLFTLRVVAGPSFACNQLNMSLIQARMRLLQGPRPSKTTFQHSSIPPGP
eukprot:5987422-Pleurochrysis_carterae.AAC.2